MNIAEQYVKEHSAELEKALIAAVAEAFKLLFSTTFSSEALKRYPFLSDKQKFYDDYMSIFVAVAEHDRVVLMIDTKRMAELHFSTALVEALEYGTEVLPPVPHLRNAEWFFK